MSAQDNSGPAFPHPDYLAAGWAGMTLRDYFAAKAMQGMIASLSGAPASMLSDYEKRASAKAYAMADAMLAQREKDPQQ